MLFAHLSKSDTLCFLFFCNSAANLSPMFKNCGSGGCPFADVCRTRHKYGVRATTGLTISNPNMSRKQIALIDSMGRLRSETRKALEALADSVYEERFPARSFELTRTLLKIDEQLGLFMSSLGEERAPDRLTEAERKKLADDSQAFVNQKTLIRKIYEDFKAKKIHFIGEDGSEVHLEDFDFVLNGAKSGVRLLGDFRKYKTGYTNGHGYSEKELFTPKFLYV